MLELLNNIDTEIFLSLNGLHSPFWDCFMQAFSGKWIWIPMYASIFFVFLKNLQWRKAFIAALCVGFAVAIADQTCATLIRPVVERIRPTNLANPIQPLVHIVDGYRGGVYGFPSCHAANSFTLAAFVAVFLANKKLNAVIFLWAITNSYSRIYLGVHYPGDLIVGGLIGIAIGCCVAIAARSLLQRMQPCSPLPPHAPARLTGVTTSVCGLTVLSITIYSVIAQNISKI